MGGLSGSVGKISGVLGDTVAKLTFDKDFQANRKRSSTSGSRSGSRSVGQGLEGAAKVLDNNNYRVGQVQSAFIELWCSFLQGFFSGVTGVFTQPIRGKLYCRKPLGSLAGDWVSLSLSHSLSLSPLASAVLIVEGKGTMAV